ncbi:MAG: hypothetical protein M1834_003254 [Cirrosporium novae-zelandiae]|nr:MAG: hypothetical protein M1834_003254 [Cirrosporium novae-zelandiae]
MCFKVNIPHENCKGVRTGEKGIFSDRKGIRVHYFVKTYKCPNRIASGTAGFCEARQSIQHIDSYGEERLSCPVCCHIKISILFEPDYYDVDKKKDQKDERPSDDNENLATRKDEMVDIGTAFVKQSILGTLSPRQTSNPQGGQFSRGQTSDYSTTFYSYPQTPFSDKPSFMRSDYPENNGANGDEVWVHHRTHQKNESYTRNGNRWDPRKSLHKDSVPNFTSKYPPKHSSFSSVPPFKHVPSAKESTSTYIPPMPTIRSSGSDITISSLGLDYPTPSTWTDSYESINEPQHCSHGKWTKSEVSNIYYDSRATKAAELYFNEGSTISRIRLRAEDVRNHGGHQDQDKIRDERQTAANRGTEEKDVFGGNILTSTGTRHLKEYKLGNKASACKANHPNASCHRKTKDYRTGNNVTPLCSDPALDEFEAKGRRHVVISPINTQLDPRAARTDNPYDGLSGESLESSFHSSGHRAITSEPKFRFSHKDGRGNYSCRRSRTVRHKTEQGVNIEFSPTTPSSRSSSSRHKHRRHARGRRESGNSIYLTPITARPPSMPTRTDSFDGKQSHRRSGFSYTSSSVHTATPSVTRSSLKDKAVPTMTSPQFYPEITKGHLPKYPKDHKKTRRHRGERREERSQLTANDLIRPYERLRPSESTSRSARSKYSHPPSSPSTAHSTNPSTQHKHKDIQSDMPWASASEIESEVYYEVRKVRIGKPSRIRTPVTGGKGSKRGYGKER